MYEHSLVRDPTFFTFPASSYARLNGSRHDLKVAPSSGNRGRTWQERPMLRTFHATSWERKEATTNQHESHLPEEGYPVTVRKLLAMRRSCPFYEQAQVEVRPTETLRQGATVSYRVFLPHSDQGFVGRHDPAQNVRKARPPHRAFLIKQQELTEAATLVF